MKHKIIYLSLILNLINANFAQNLKDMDDFKNELELIREKAQKEQQINKRKKQIAYTNSRRVKRDSNGMNNIIHRESIERKIVADQRRDELLKAQQEKRNYEQRRKDRMKNAVLNSSFNAYTNTTINKKAPIGRYIDNLHSVKRQEQRENNIGKDGFTGYTNGTDRETKASIYDPDSLLSKSTKDRNAKNIRESTRNSYQTERDSVVSDNRASSSKMDTKSNSNSNNRSSISRSSLSNDSGKSSKQAFPTFPEFLKKKKQEEMAAKIERSKQQRKYNRPQSPTPLLTELEAALKERREAMHPRSSISSTISARDSISYKDRAYEERHKKIAEEQVKEDQKKRNQEQKRKLEKLQPIFINDSIKLQLDLKRQALEKQSSRSSTRASEWK